MRASDTSHFAPYLTNLNMNFGISTATFRSLFGGGSMASGGQPAGGSQSVLNDPNRDNYLQNQGSRPIRPATSYDATGAGTQRGFTSNFAFTVQRFRPSDYPAPLVKPQDQVAVNYTISFAPTQFWAASWQAQYNFSLKRFESQTVTLQRELHEWRASFRFVGTRTATSPSFSRSSSPTCPTCGMTTSRRRSSSDCPLTATTWTVRT